MKKLPKIELHCHLDGSVRVNTIIDIAKKENIKLDSYKKCDIEKIVQVPSDCTCLNEYLKRFDLPNKVMQNSKNLKRITFELLEDAYSENVKYIEIRFAPMLHLNGGLSVKEVIQSVIDGINEAEKTVKELGLELIIENEVEELNKESTIISEQVPIQGVIVNKGSKVYAKY